MSNSASFYTPRLQEIICPLFTAQHFYIFFVDIPESQKNVTLTHPVAPDSSGTMEIQFLNTFSSDPGTKFVTKCYAISYPKPTDPSEDNPISTYTLKDNKGTTNTGTVNPPIRQPRDVPGDPSVAPRGNDAATSAPAAYSCEIVAAISASNSQFVFSGAIVNLPSGVVLEQIPDVRINANQIAYPIAISSNNLTFSPVLVMYPEVYGSSTDQAIYYDSICVQSHGGKAGMYRNNDPDPSKNINNYTDPLICVTF